VTVSVRVLSTEDRADLENTAEISRDSLLFSQLGALCEESPAAEVVDREDSSATLCGSRLKLRCVDLDKAILFEGVSEDSGDH
jgi:hypothetical protein